MSRAGVSRRPIRITTMTTMTTTTPGFDPVRWPQA